MDSRSYPLLKKQSQEILEKIGWDANTEFKRSCLFSASKGSTGVDVQKHVDAAHELLDLNASEKKSRLRFAYGRINSTDKGADYLSELPRLLRLSKILPKAPKGAGKNLILVVCDDRDDVDADKLLSAIKLVLNEKGYVILERVTQTTSAPDTVGLMFGDLVEYLVGRVDTIANDTELFEGLDQKQLATNGKIRKLKSSSELIKKIKKLDLYQKK